MPAFPLTPRSTLRLRLVRQRTKLLPPAELVTLPAHPRSVRVVAPLFRGMRARVIGPHPA